MQTTHQEVQEYYGKTLNSSEDLQTNACCTLSPPPEYIREILPLIAEEVQAKYYGCGLTIPTALEGLKVLDLGSGSGRDTYITAKLVGETGSVVGVDMTPEQLSVARTYEEFHREKFGYAQSNVRFLEGNLDYLSELDLEKGSFDLVISNCVINLVADKQGLFEQVYSLLKPGGEMYFSDVYTDRRVPQALREDKLLWGECLSGALYWNDFLNMAKSAGFTDPRVIEDRPITIDNEALASRTGEINFHSVTYRLMKIQGLESDCEDYGQAVRYRGGLKECPDAFTLDNHHHFPKGKMITVCGNTYKMLHDTRLQPYFEFFGNWEVHYGIFEGCGGNSPFTSDNSDSVVSCC